MGAHDGVSFRLLLRALAFLLAIGAAATVGASIGCWVAPPELSLPWRVVLPITAVATLAMASGALALALPTALRFIRCGAPHFGGAVQELLPSLLLVVLGAGLIGSTLQKEKGPEGGDERPSASIEVVFSHRANHDAIFFPFFPVEGSSKSCDPNQSNFGDAQELEGDSVKRTVKRFFASLQACAADKDNPLRIDVRGYASSSEFKGCARRKTDKGESVSDVLNVRLAEARRQTLLKLIRQVAPDVVVEPETPLRFQDQADIRAHSLFKDVDQDGKYSRDRGALTRRAEVVVLSKGDCQLP